MKTNLPKAPIQIQRDSLLLEVSQLKNTLFQKEQEINLLTMNLSKNGNLESSISQKDNVIQNLQNQLNNKDTIITNQIEKIKVLQDKLSVTLVNSSNNNNLELTMLKEQLADKKSIIELIQNDNKAYKIKVEKLKTKLAEYTLNEISITHSEMLNNEIDESIVLSGTIIEENND